MKDYTLVANNKSKTKITFHYDHGLPYKDKIRPQMEYGDWEEDETKTLIKINFIDEDMKLFEKKDKILGFDNHDLEDEYWIDLEDAYLIIRKDDYLEKRFKEHNVIIAFFHNNKFLNTLKY